MLNTKSWQSGYSIGLRAYRSLLFYIKLPHVIKPIGFSSRKQPDSGRTLPPVMAQHPFQAVFFPLVIDLATFLANYLVERTGPHTQVYKLDGFNQNLCLFIHLLLVWLCSSSFISPNFATIINYCIWSVHALAFLQNVFISRKHQPKGFQIRIRLPQTMPRWFKV